MEDDASPRDVRQALLHAAREELSEHGRAAISLRAVARRAGVSHAAPKHHFRDRAGLLTAVATDGFQLLGEALNGVRETDPAERLAALGRTYIRFALDNPALYDLMFQPGEITVADTALAAARMAATVELSAAAQQLTSPNEHSDGVIPPLALLSWAVVHGLVGLARDGALQIALGQPKSQGLTAAQSLSDMFSERVSVSAPGPARPR